jgi:hypothetical protein
MKRHIAHTALGIILCSMLLGAAQTAQAAQAQACTMSDVAGKYGYTSGGTIVSPPVGPFTAVGHVTLTGSGTFSGAQTTSIAGNFFEETVQGSFTVNSDCTGSATVYVYHGSTLVRTTELHLVWDHDENEMRAIFLAPGTAITLAARKMSYDDQD